MCEGEKKPLALSTSFGPCSVNATAAKLAVPHTVENQVARYETVVESRPLRGNDLGYVENPKVKPPSPVPFTITTSTMMTHHLLLHDVVLSSLCMRVHGEERIVVGCWRGIECEDEGYT